MTDSTVTLKFDGLDAIQGFATDLTDSRGYAFESAISCVAEAAKGAQDMTLLVLQAHLKDLCAAQLAFLSRFEQPDGSL